MTANKPLKIYIVDDDAELIEFMVLVLEAQGHRVFADIGAAIAIPRIAAKRPDVVLVDLMMPEVDGLELCRELRAKPELKNTAIVFVSARTEDLWRDRATEMGADGYIEKPLLAETFAELVENAVAAARAGAEQPAAAGAVPGRR